MKICMVSMHCCIRVFKEARALKERGHEVHCLAMKESMGWNMYDSYSLFMDEKNCGQLIRMYDRMGIDVFHVHNEPDHLVGWVRKYTDKPIVFDCHDLQSLRAMSPPEPYEIQSFAQADAVVHVSKSVQKLSEVYHPNQKSIVLKSYVNREFIPPTEKIQDRCKSSVIYQGGVSDHPGSGRFKNYRYLMPMVKAFHHFGHDVHIFAATSVNTAEYMQNGAIMSGPYPYPAMIRALKLYGLGFVGACIDVPIMEAALPNKLFEYMVNGIVPVVMFGKEAADLVQEYDCGIILGKDFDDLPDRLKDVEKKRSNLMKIHMNFVMEDQINILEELYHDLVS